MWESGGGVGVSLGAQVGGEGWGSERGQYVDGGWVG